MSVTKNYKTVTMHSIHVRNIKLLPEESRTFTVPKLQTFTAVIIPFPQVLIKIIS